MNTTTNAGEVLFNVSLGVSTTVLRPRRSRAGTHSEGNLGDVRSLGEGVLERRVPFGPGYRIYFGRDGETLIILLSGGDKRRQQRDIHTARSRWQRYKRMKSEKLE